PARRPLYALPHRDPPRDAERPDPVREVEDAGEDTDREPRKHERVGHEPVHVRVSDFGVEEVVLEARRPHVPADEEEADDAGEPLERVEPGGEVVVTEGVVELGLTDAHEAVRAVEEERPPDEQDLDGEEDLPRDRTDPTDEPLEALAAGQDEGVLKEDV